MKPVFIGGDEAEPWTFELDRILEEMWTADLETDEPNEANLYEEIELLAGIEIAGGADPGCPRG